MSAEAHRTGPVAPGELRPGDSVRVRPAAAILETLDETGAFEGVPFMPEMLEYVGTTMVVYKRAEKICDYFGETTRTRRMTGTVLLEDARCSGSAHGGCQAECRIFWKEAWLEHAVANTPAEAAEAGLAELDASVARHTERCDGGEIAYRCQATEAVASSTPMGELSPGQYVREVRVGNVSAAQLVKTGTQAIVRKIARRFGRPHLPIELAGADRVDGDKLDLKPGEWVRVRDRDAVGSTLNEAAAHRGLLFTLEMVPTCGRSYRVRRRVEKIIDERTGRMREFKNDCISLDGAVCTGRLTPGAWFCPREHFPLYREAWLERVDPPDGG